jgi:hypothetical protein
MSLLVQSLGSSSYQVDSELYRTYMLKSFKNHTVCRLYKWDLKKLIKTGSNVRALPCMSGA